MNLNEAKIKDTQNGITIKHLKMMRFEDNQFVRMIDAEENLIAVGFYDESEKLFNRNCFGIN